MLLVPSFYNIFLGVSILRFFLLAFGLLGGVELFAAPPLFCEPIEGSFTDIKGRHTIKIQKDCSFTFDPSFVTPIILVHNPSSPTYVPVEFFTKIWKSKDDKGETVWKLNGVFKSYYGCVLPFNFMFRLKDEDQRLEAEISLVSENNHQCSVITWSSGFIDFIRN